MAETTNYKLEKPAESDYADIAALNRNADRIDAALKGLEDGKASLSDDGKIPAAQLPEMDYVPNSEKGAAGGVASLGTDGKVPAGQLPSMNYAAEKHASQHASGGSDPVTPGSIGAASLDLSNVSDQAFMDKASAAGAGGVPLVSAESTDGLNYTASVPGLSELTVGTAIIIVPTIKSTGTGPNLNVNGFGKKFIKRRVSTSSSALTSGAFAGWLEEEMPVFVIYNGTYWVVEDLTKPSASDLYGTVAVSNGGTGATTASAARTNLDAAPAYTYGTTDLTAGTSALTNGVLYFQYE